MSANRISNAVYTTAELKTIQEMITLAVFAGFSTFYLQEPLGWNHAIGFALITPGRLFYLPTMVDCRNPAQKLMLVPAAMLGGDHDFLHSQV